LAERAVVRYRDVMGKRVVLGGLLVVLAACGGHVESDSTFGDSSRAPQRDDEQGLYFPGESGLPENVAVGLGAPTAIAMTDDRVLFTTRTTILEGESVEAGALYAIDKRGGSALALAVDRRGASFDALVTDGKTAFIATSDARLLAMPASGGTPSTLATLAAPAVTLTLSGGYVYFATDTGALARVAAAGGAVEQAPSEGSTRMIPPSTSRRAPPKSCPPASCACRSTGARSRCSRREASRAR
jgi:hypothetical protein